MSGFEVPCVIAGVLVGLLLRVGREREAKLLGIAIGRRQGRLARTRSEFGLALPTPDPLCRHERTFDNTTFERCIDCGMVRYAFEDWKTDSPGFAAGVVVTGPLPWSWERTKDGWKFDREKAVLCGGYAAIVGDPETKRAFVRSIAPNLSDVGADLIAGAVAERICTVPK